MLRNLRSPSLISSQASDFAVLQLGLGHAAIESHSENENERYCAAMGTRSEDYNNKRNCAAIETHPERNLRGALGTHSLAKAGPASTLQAVASSLILAGAAANYTHLAIP